MATYPDRNNPPPASAADPGFHWVWNPYENQWAQIANSTAGKWIKVNGVDTWVDDPNVQYAPGSIESPGARTLQARAERRWREAMGRWQRAGKVMTDEYGRTWTDTSVWADGTPKGPYPTAAGFYAEEGLTPAQIAALGEPVVNWFMMGGGDEKMGDKTPTTRYNPPTYSFTPKAPAAADDGFSFQRKAVYGGNAPLPDASAALPLITAPTARQGRPAWATSRKAKQGKRKNTWKI